MCRVVRSVASSSAAGSVLCALVLCAVLACGAFPVPSVSHCSVPWFHLTPVGQVVDVSAAVSCSCGWPLCCCAAPLFLVVCFVFSACAVGGVPCVAVFDVLVLLMVRRGFRLLFALFLHVCNECSECFEFVFYVRPRFCCVGVDVDFGPGCFACWPVVVTGRVVVCWCDLPPPAPDERSRLGAGLCDDAAVLSASFRPVDD
ncbi:hypothetical protein ERJ75_001303000 [Trypanosoma vivax]|nr:hypothetical protein ERJ75_001303000 [Trypanosoma vivax]